MPQRSFDMLENIKSPRDIKELNDSEINLLRDELREKIIDTVSKNGGHLASNLGMVDTTVALHRVFNSPEDTIIFDVGHQCYAHKLLTGRYDRFATLRTEGGISGFSRPTESEHDIFYSGHSGTSVSSAYGVACGNLLNEEKNYTVAVIGDGSFTGGLVYEALNNAGRVEHSRLIVVLNENEMSISQNVGAFAKYMTIIRSKPEYIKMKAKTEAVLDKIPLIGKPLARFILKVKTDFKNQLYGSTLFEDMGFRYMGPFDGHNLSQLKSAFETAKLIRKPVLLHVHTTKGKGYDHAERQPSVFHGISRFDIDTGEPLSKGTSFSEQFGDFMCKAALSDRTICAVTAAMSLGTGLKGFEERYPRRFFDVGIAEEHAVTFASGLAKSGMKPVVAIYSTFLQRAYDEIFHDGALQKQNIVLAIDRAGLVGEDGETHQGIYDVAFLNSIPDVKIYAPSNYEELKEYMKKALYEDEGLTAVRYPRGKEESDPDDFVHSYGAYDVYGDKDADMAIVTYGRISSYALNASKELFEKGIKTKVIKLGRIKPIDERAVEEVFSAKKIYFFEEGVRSAGAGEKFALMLLEKGYGGAFDLTAIPDCFVPQASVSSQLQRYGLDKQSMIKKISE
ncbi:MAG: 1-deoxy-D-xylulose-5-phosphate synthase [Clostridia bacterium]|nr:1-deoxy-D-xylulose-5-phosphate synthase [Clostridia bacterium]